MFVLGMFVLVRPRGKQTQTSTGCFSSSPELFQLLFYVFVLGRFLGVGVVNPSLLRRVEEAAAGRLSRQCFSWESRRRGAHLHLYYLWELEHHNEKCVKDWRLSGSHTHAAHSNVNCCSDVSPLILMISHRFGGALCEEKQTLPCKVPPPRKYNSESVNVFRFTFSFQNQLIYLDMRLYWPDIG